MIRYISARNCFTLLIIILMLSLLSCGSTSKVWLHQKESFRDSSVAIVGLDMRESMSSKQLSTVSNQISDGIVVYFLQSGFKVIERSRLDVLSKETELQRSGVLSLENAIKLGHIANVQYVIYGCGNVEFTMGAPFVRDVAIKMVNVETGEVVLVLNWSAVALHLNKVIASIGEEIVKAFEQK